ncbi:hypothetical protein LCGC14_3138910 [marine sediment metagenome]|uniref:Uncharacterized protein n=1 Tax=marine sediment metagenome TaxID=412755 RepID=A0A0F8VXF1_9ZZZZ
MENITILEWVIIGVIGLNGFVWLVLPFIFCPRMFDGYFSSSHLSFPPPGEREGTGE